MFSKSWALLAIATLSAVSQVSAQAALYGQCARFLSLAIILILCICYSWDLRLMGTFIGIQVVELVGREPRLAFLGKLHIQLQFDINISADSYRIFRSVCYSYSECNDIPHIKSAFTWR